MGVTGSKRTSEIAEPRKAFSDDDIFRHSSKRGTKSKNSIYFSNQPLRPKSAKTKSQNSDSKPVRDGIKTPTNIKSSIWNRKSKRSKTSCEKEDEVDKVCKVDIQTSETVRRLSKFHGSDETVELWEEGFENGENVNEWNTTSVHRSYDCLNANSSLFQDSYLSRSFNPLVASKLPFMLSYELKPSLVAHLSSIKSPDHSSTVKPGDTNSSGYACQMSYQSPISKVNGAPRNVNKRHQVDVSRYLIDSNTAKRNVEGSTSRSEKTTQDDMFQKDLAKTLAKLVDKAGTNEYRKFCNMARAYSVDFSDVYIADFLESVETLAKLAKPVSTPTTSPFRRVTHNSTGNCSDISNMPKTNIISPSLSNSTRRYTSDHLWKTTGDSVLSDRSATLGPNTFSCHKKASRIPIPIGTKVIERSQKEYQSINFVTSPSTRALKNGFKHLPNNQCSAPKEVLSAIQEVQEANVERKEANCHLSANPPSTTKVLGAVSPFLSSLPSKCCCFCEESLNPMERMDCEILSKNEKSSLSSSSNNSQFDVDFFYVDKDTKKPSMSFEEVLRLKRNKQLVQVQEIRGPTCGLKPTSPALRPRSRKYRPVSLFLLTDSSDRYVPVARLTIRKRCTCEAQMRRLCTFLESPGCCLAEVTLAECSFEPAAILRLSKAIEINESLKILNLESCNLEDDFAMLLGAALRHNATLTRLSLAKNSIGSRGIFYLNQGLSRNMTLQDLSLDYNFIMNEGCKILSGLLVGNRSNKICTSDQTDNCATLTAENSPKIKSSLRKLSLKSNKIGPEGACQMFLALRHVTNLTELDLSGNQIEDSSLEILGNILLFNRSLKILKLDNCGLTWRSCEFLRRPLKTNTDLSILSLDLNQLTDLGVSYLSEGLQYNRNLKELSLNMCSVTSIGLESLVSVIKSRTALRTLRLCYNDISIADNSNASFIYNNHVELMNTSLGECNSRSKKDQDIRANQALHALDQCLRESQKNLLEESLWDEIEASPIERYSVPPINKHQGKHSFNSSLYRKMIMALKRNPSLRIVMWGNQRPT